MRIANIVTKFTAIVRGFLVRCHYKKFKLIALVEGKKAHQIDMREIYQMPRSNVKEVMWKETELGCLKLDGAMKEQIKRGREQGRLAFENGHELHDGQVYSG